MPVTSPGAVQDAEYVGSWFVVELDNGIEGFWTDASGLAIEIEVVEKTDDGEGDTMTRKRPGTTKYQEINLKRTLSPDKKFWDVGQVDPRRHEGLPHQRRHRAVRHLRHGDGSLDVRERLAVEVVGIRPRRRHATTSCKRKSRCRSSC